MPLFPPAIVFPYTTLRRPLPYRVSPCICGGNPFSPYTRQPQRRTGRRLATLRPLYVCCGRPAPYHHGTQRIPRCPSNPFSPIHAITSRNCWGTATATRSGGATSSLLLATSACSGPPSPQGTAVPVRRMARSRSQRRRYWPYGVIAYYLRRLYGVLVSGGLRQRLLRDF